MDYMTIWTAWFRSGHYDKGCLGWTQDSRERDVICACGATIPLHAPAWRRLYARLRHHLAASHG